MLMMHRAGRALFQRLLMPLVLSAGIALAPLPASAGMVEPDPYGSVMWEYMAKTFFPGEQVVFDERVVLLAPLAAEDQFHVPITVDISALDDVVEVVAVADLNPIPHVLTVRPHQPLNLIGFRLKLQQTSPIHVGARTRDGIWHMSGAVVDAAGGGCTAPAMAHGESDWMSRLGETRAMVSRESASFARLSLRLYHPMDTGLAAGIPAFYMNTLNVTDDAGNPVADVEMFEPVSENPTLTLTTGIDAGTSALHVRSRDTEGNIFEFPLEVPVVAN